VAGGGRCSRRGPGREDLLYRLKATLGRQPAVLGRAAPRPRPVRDNHQMDHLDNEGYIQPEADLANVQPEYQGLPDATADLLADEFGSRLHSAYLYGSVVRGNAVPGRSDLDVIAVLLAAPADEDRARADRVERALVQRFPVLVSAGVGLTHLQQVRSPAQRYGGQVFLRELAVCICGEDLRPGLPRTKPSAAVAAGFHADTHAVFARARETLGTSTDPKVIRGVCRMASKKMVQVAFAVVMAREGVWATVLEEQAAAVGAAFPQWAEAARRAAEQGRRPVADAGVVRELLDTFGRWAEKALDRSVSEASNLDGRAR
jgi:predicted nucleotidyltransferase